MKRIFTSLVAMLLLLNISFAQTSLTEAVDFDVTTVHGEEYNLFALLDEGKHVIIDFFFTTCPPCIASVPTVNDSYEKYGCNKGDIVYLAIDAGDTNAEVLQYETDHGGLLPSVSGTEGGGDAVVGSYGIGAFPTVILIAPDRSILSQDIFPVTETNLDAAITGAGLTENSDACSLTSSIYDLDKNVAEIVSVFPNPVSEFTNLQFSVPATTDITIEVFNMMGQKVSTVSSETYAAGLHNVEVPVTELANGAYTINLTSPEGVVAVSKISVLK